MAFSLIGSRAGRAVAVLLLVAGLLSTSAVPAGAAPTVAENSDTAAVSAWPVDLQQLVNGTHSPGHIRAFAPLRNIDAWYDAFGVKPGDALYIAPQDRVRIW